MSKRVSRSTARRLARQALMQAIYAWQMTGATLADLREQFTTSDQMRKGDVDFFLTCLRTIVSDVAKVDALFEPYLDRQVQQLDGVERAILRAGAHELHGRMDVPARVTLDEWIELARVFGATDSYRYVNGVLDRVARDFRQEELQADFDSGQQPADQSAGTDPKDTGPDDAPLSNDAPSDSDDGRV